MKAASAAIVTIGNFDGVHLGHQKLIQEVVARAGSLGHCSMAITFDPHPDRVLFPERQIAYLSSPEERVDLLHAIGIDDVWVCPFTRELAKLEPPEFMRLVSERQRLAELWVGADFALGRGRQGTISVLSELGSAFGWGLHVVPPYRLAGQVVSSTAIRTLLGAGAVRGAADLLGRPYSVRGQLQGSDLVVDRLRALPKTGAYDAQVQANGTVKNVRAVVPEVPGLVVVGPASSDAVPDPIGPSPVSTHTEHVTLTFLRRID